MERFMSNQGDGAEEALSSREQELRLSVDVDERKKAEDRLRRGEAYLAEAQRLSHTGSFGWTPSTGELHWSDETFRILEYDPSIKPTVERVLQRIHPDDRAMIRQLLDETSSGEKDFDVTHRLLMPDGSVKFVHVLSHALKDAAGNLEIVGALMDVTENTLLYRDRAEREARLVERTKALRRSEAYLAEAERLSHTGTLVLNATTWQFVYLSDESYRIWGLDSMQGLPSLETIRQRFHPDDRDRVWQKVQEALRQKKDYSGELRIVLPNGTVKYLAVNAHHLFSTNGELVEVIATCADVTDHKRAEQALRENEGKFRDYAETASDWFWEIGPDYKFTMLTENAFGSHAADRIGTACWDHVLDLETEPEKWRLVWTTLDSRQPFRDFVYCSLGGDGAPMYVKASGKPIFDSNGEFRGYRGTGTDVTALMRAQEEHERLRQLEADLAHMNRLSTMGELAASLAHEIAQPIATARNNARAALHFLDRSSIDLGQVREALTCVVDDADRAGEILDHIRDHIKKAPPRKEHVDLNQAITDVIALAQGAIIKNGVSVQIRLTEGLPHVQADGVQVQQVVLNLILNAVEAMSLVKKGVRELAISTEQHKAGGVLVAVRDSGPGIDSKHLERVFEAFYTTKSSGVGMGLSICRSIINAHGGRLWADVNASRGAVFRFTLPGADEELTNSLRPAHLSREPHEDTVSDGAHRPAYEGNKRPHR
jgi:PAS domain S-box-containing protein